MNGLSNDNRIRYQLRLALSLMQLKILYFQLVKKLLFLTAELHVFCVI